MHMRLIVRPMHAPAALLDEGQVDGEPWHKAYLQTDEPPQEHTIMLTEEDEVAFAQEPRQAILIVGPNGPGKLQATHNSHGLCNNLESTLHVSVSVCQRTLSFSGVLC